MSRLIFLVVLLFPVVVRGELLSEVFEHDAELRHGFRVSTTNDVTIISSSAKIQISQSSTLDTVTGELTYQPFSQSFPSITNSFQRTLSHFLPVTCDLSGCTGGGIVNQTFTVSISTDPFEFSLLNPVSTHLTNIGPLSANSTGIEWSDDFAMTTISGMWSIAGPNTVVSGQFDIPTTPTPKLFLDPIFIKRDTGSGPVVNWNGAFSLVSLLQSENIADDVVVDGQSWSIDYFGSTVRVPEPSIILLLGLVGIGCGGIAGIKTALIFFR